MSAVPPSMAGLIKRRNEPVVVQTLRSTAAAVLAFVAAVSLSDNAAPLLAPLTALLVVQVTLYATLTTGLRRVVSVVAGVLLAVGFSELVGLSWWSLGLLILASLLVGHLLRVDEFVPEVAISAMLVLGVTHVTQTALGRVFETLIGAGVGVLLNAVFAPPVFVQPASEAIEELTRRMHRLLRHIGRELRGGASVDQAVAWLHEARRVDQEIARVDGALSRAEESTRLNPHVRRGLQARVILRSGLDTLEIFAVVLRTLCRSMADLSQERGTREAVYPREAALALEGLFEHLAAAVDSFGRLITAQITAGAERAESELSQALARGRGDRHRIAGLLMSEMEREPDRWVLHGALLANVDRLLNELDVEKRSQRLAAEFDRHARARRAQHALVHRMRQRARMRRRRMWQRFQG